MVYYIHMNQSHGSVEPRHTAPPTTVFLATAVLIFFFALSAADSIGFVPSYIDGSSLAQSEDIGVSEETLSQDEVAVPSIPPETIGIPALPERIAIPSINLDLAVQNPDTRDLAELDEILKDGPARFSGSAKVGEAGGNVIIFAHSSRVPVVHNQMYKAFNRISELVAGDTVTIEADGKKHLYMVTSVKKVDASDTRIDMSKSLGTRLTLITCDTLTSKDARFVLEASFIGTYTL